MGWFIFFVVLLWVPPLLSLFLIAKLAISLSVKIWVWIAITIVYNFLVFRFMKEKNAITAGIISSILFFVAVGLFGYLQREGFFEGWFRGGDCEMNRMSAVSCN